jgi:hypothetical protein
LLLKQTYKPKVAGVLLITLGVGIPLLILLVGILVFLPDTLGPATGGKTDFGAILFRFVLLLFVLWILPILGGNKAIKQKGGTFVSGLQ